MTVQKSTFVLACLCALLAGALARDLLVPTARATDACGLREQDVRELLRSLEKNADATKGVSDATRHVAEATKGVADAVRNLKR